VARNGVVAQEKKNKSKMDSRRGAKNGNFYCEQLQHSIFKYGLSPDRPRRRKKEKSSQKKKEEKKKENQEKKKENQEKEISI